MFSRMVLCRSSRPAPAQWSLLLRSRSPSTSLVNSVDVVQIPRGNQENSTKLTSYQQFQSDHLKVP